MARNQPHWLKDWLARHRSPISFWLHMFGVPLTLAGLALTGHMLLVDRWDIWPRPVGLFVAGYLLQFIGHRHEGNDMGEVILLKRLLGKPYVGVSPRYAGED